MNIKRQIATAVLYTLATTLFLGIGYPLAVTAIAHVLAPDKSIGQIISRNGNPIGSRIIAQPFTGERYFHPRPSAAGAAGYDASNSGGSNLGPTNKQLIDRVTVDVAAAKRENPAAAVPSDMVTTSGSGLDPDISVANARFQASRVARARQMPIGKLLSIIDEHTTRRQLGFLGEPRVNVLELNLELDTVQAAHR